jgi:hypothetical protein
MRIAAIFENLAGLDVNFARWCDMFVPVSGTNWGPAGGNGVVQGDLTYESFLGY